MNVSQGAFRLWVVFAVLWASFVGLIWHSTIQQSFEHGCWFQTAQVEPAPPPAKPVDPWEKYLKNPADPLMGYKPPNLCEHEYPSVMLPDIAKAVLIVPAILLAFGLALRWAFMGFRAAKPVDGPRGTPARIRRELGRP